MLRITSDTAQFALVSFEGPDEYARAGGLATRVRDLAETLAGAGFATHLFFIGDPNLPAVEERGNLVLHRWSQWISQHHPGGVYDGEAGKMEDLATSLPPVLADDIVRSGAAQRKVTVVMGEDWQTAGAMIHAGYVFRQRGLLRHVIPVWTANNLYGFEGIDFRALTEAAAILTVSKYMKHQMWKYGLNPLVTPNGLSPASIVNVSPAQAKRLRAAFDCDAALFKIGRFSPDKGWLPALEAVGILRNLGSRVRILIRGDKLPYGQEVLARAQGYGLRVANLTQRYNTVAELAAGIAATRDADVLNLTAFLPDTLLPPIYAAVDGVLANSGHEPFGLVGLEVMGAGGLAYVGTTGEEYAESNRNAVTLDTDDPLEIAAAIERLRGEPETVRGMKRRGKETARAYVWPEIAKQLFAKLEYVALVRGVEVPR